MDLWTRKNQSCSRCVTDTKGNVPAAVWHRKLQGSSPHSALSLMLCGVSVRFGGFDQGLDNSSIHSGQEQTKVHQQRSGGQNAVYEQCLEHTV